MTLQIGTNTRPAVLRGFRAEVRAFLDRHFAGQAGWLCLGWIDGDPDIEAMVEEWYDWPRQTHQVINRALELAERGCNLYVGVCLFSSRKRAYATALPSRWLWLDDAAIVGAELVESSAGNYQSWFQLDEPLSAEERSALQRAIRDQVTGADTCSADAVHMARMPGGWNRKRHGAWRVCVAQEADRVFSVAELRRRYPRAAQPAHQTAEVGDWSDLPSGARLASSARFRRLVEANEQLRKVCAGEAVAIRMKNGRLDDSPSNQRAIFVAQLIRAHYPHDEIRALALHFSGVLESKPKWFKTDIDNLLRPVDQDGYTPADYKPDSTRGSHAQEPPRGGRHRALTAGELLAWLHEQAECGRRGLVVELSRGEIAQALGVSYGTVQRCERELGDRVRREASDDRQRSYLILSPATWDVCTERITERFDQTLPTEDGTRTDVRSKLDAPHQDTANEPPAPQCNERARGNDHEITHPPGCSRGAREPFAFWEAFDPPIGDAELRVLVEAPARPPSDLAVATVGGVSIPEPEPPTIVSVGKPDARGMRLVHWSNGSATWRREIPKIAEIAEQDAPEPVSAISCKTDLPAGDDALNMAEIERMVAEIQAVADARRDEQREPRPYWESHEARVWRESHAIAPQAPALYEQRAAEDQAGRARIRAAWDALGDDPRALGERLGKLRNRLRKYPQSRRALEWQIHELHDRLAALTPVSEAVGELRPCPPARGRGPPVAQRGALL